MNEPIHVYVKVIDRGVAAVEGLRLCLAGFFEYFGIAHAHPLEEDWDSHPTISIIMLAYKRCLTYILRLKYDPAFV